MAILFTVKPPGLVAGHHRLLFWCFWHYLIIFDLLIRILDHVGHEAGKAEEAFTGHQMFPNHLDKYLKGAPANARDVGLHTHGILELEGPQELNMVHRCRDHDRTGHPHRCY